MSRPRRKMTLLCLACGAPVRRGKYRLCSTGCGARLHTDYRSPCTDAHAPVCPNHQPHPEAIEGEPLMNTPAEIQSRFAARTRAIQEKRDLTPHAKKTMLARLYIEARDALDGLKAGEVARIQRQREQLDRKLFGTNGLSPDPQAVIARRDANDRAAKLDTPTEAEYALHRAEREGDRIMAKAIAAKAADYSGDPSWAEILTTYVADKPDEAATLQAMQELPDTDDGVWQLTKAMEYGLPAPRELGDHLHPHQLSAIAAQSLDADAPTAA